MPCPHNEITIVQRSQRQSAVAAAAYQSGEKLFCEYDQQVKHYPEKRGIVHNEILLPANAPRSYADRNTLWNAAEAVEKQWNSQLARRWVLTIPREIPPDQYAVLVREFCEQQFVSKGMIADFAIHDPHPPGHNPHAHKDITVIVAHLGGGITVNLHHNGRIEDCVNDEEGPFSPERAGGLPMYDVIHRSFEEGQSDKSMMKLVKSRGDLLDHLGTTDCREVEHRIQNGDAHAKLIYDAMALNVAKFIGKTAPGVCGKVDAILLTGGITYSDSIDEEIRRRVSFIAPVIVYPGEDEMQSLAFGCLRVLRGEETARTYTKVE